MHDDQTIMAATRPTDLKYNNRRQILQLFKSGAVRSVAGIAADIGISRQTVMKSIQFYLERGIIVSEGKAASGSMGGKRAELFRLSGDMYLMNVLFAPDYIYASIINFRGEALDDCTCQDISMPDFDAMVAKAGEVCRTLVEKQGIPMDRVKAVCIALPGIIDQKSNRVRFNAFFPDWGKNVPLAEKLSRYFAPDTLIITENVAKVCGSAYLYDDRVFRGHVATVFSGWGGISACMMSYGRILSGSGYMIGEIGHMSIAPEDDEVCGCGCRGCFERQVSPARLHRIIRERREEYRDSTLLTKPVESITINDIFEASEKNDPLGRMLSNYTAHCFSLALRSLSLVFNPEWVVFQGDYACVDDCFRTEFYRELQYFRGLEDSDGQNSPFALETDKRSVQDLTTLGAYTLLIDLIFDERMVYL